MEPIEVRIGNYVLVPPTDSKVLLPSVARQIKGITSLDEFEIAAGHFDIMIKIPAKHCKGIKLQTSHLEYIGFRKINDIQYLHKAPNIMIEDCHEYFLWTLNENMIIRIDYVHQLQNLLAEFTVNNFIPDFSSYFKQHSGEVPYHLA